MTTSPYQIEVNRARPFGKLVKFWQEIFNVPASVFQTAWNARVLNDRLTVCALDGSSIVATVQIYFNRMIGTDGSPIKVGCIANVATHPSVRGKGLASALMKQAVAECAAAGCEFGYLFTGTPDFYERLGWKSMTTQGFTMPLNPKFYDEVAPPPSPEYEIDVMAAIDRSGRYLNPLAVDRSPLYWHSCVSQRLSNRSVFQTEYAYFIFDLEEKAIEVAEVRFTSAFQGEREFNTFRRWLEEMGYETLNSRVMLPSISGGTPTTVGAGMVYSISPEFDIDGLFSSPGASFSPLDAF